MMAEEQGMNYPDDVVQVLAEGVILLPSMSGRDLVAFWEKEGLIGSRSEIQDSQVHARALRAHAERRGSRTTDDSN